MVKFRHIWSHWHSFFKRITTNNKICLFGILTMDNLIFSVTNNHHQKEKKAYDPLLISQGCR